MMKPEFAHKLSFGPWHEMCYKVCLYTLYIELYHNVTNGLVGFDSLACYFTTKAELPSTENKRVYYTDVEYAEGYSGDDFFNDIVINRAPQKDTTLWVQLANVPA